MHLLKGKAVFAALAVTALFGVAACGSSSSNTTTTKSTASSPPSSTSTTPSVTASSFTNDYSAMTALKPLAAQGKGAVAAILPDTTTSTRYVAYDAPALKAAMTAAGLPSSEIIVQNALGSDSTFLTDAESDVTKGASVLLIDPGDSGVGVQVENYAKAHGVAVVNYDRLTVGGPPDPYVSFDNVQVGKLIGQGFVSCVSAWHVSHPNLVMMRGDPTDNNAGQFAQGYVGVLQPYFASKKYTEVANTAGTWTAPTALTEFEQAYTAHPNINSAVIPNDANAAPIVTYLKSHGIKPNTFPTTGQDASLTGLQNVLSGYQCGSVYKPNYKEAQATVALALYLRAGKTAPASLLNSTVTDPKNKDTVPSVLLSPTWTTVSNMASTVIKDKYVPTKQLCAGASGAPCKKYGIT
ncbi:MAG: D-xylose transport system substrate-binding protein [Solirubrobacteraceae bacterium]|nr:D-xylose transport system substrate-binding protein [Solirubrobacteraceae bacterium]